MTHKHTHHIMFVLLIPMFSVVPLNALPISALPMTHAVSLLSSAPQHLSQWVATNPRQSTMAIYTLRGLCGDYIAQCMEGRTKLDQKRVAVYVVWCNLVGEFYTRPWACLLCPRWFPTFVDGQIHLLNIFNALVLENFVLSPFLYLPAFYLFKNAADGCFNAKASLMQYKKEFWPQMRAMWLLWIPATLINLIFVPTHMRAVWTGLIGRIWVTAMSLTTSSLTVTDILDKSECRVSYEDEKDTPSTVTNAVPAAKLS